MRLGKISFPKAIKELRLNSNIPLENLMKKIATKSLSPVVTQNSNLSPEDLLLLEGYIQKCYQDMADPTVHAIANSDSMAEAGELLAVLNKFYASNHSRSDFVNVVLYAILFDALEKHIRNIKKIPAFVQAVQKTGLTWK